MLSLGPIPCAMIRWAKSRNHIMSIYPFLSLIDYECKYNTFFLKKQYLKQKIFENYFFFKFFLKFFICVNGGYFLKNFSGCIYGGYYSTPPPGFARWGLHPRSSLRTDYTICRSDKIQSYYQI